MPQKGNRTGLQEVRGEEGGVQLGGAVEKDREEGGEGRRMAADIVGAGGQQYSVVVRAGGTGLANSGQYGFDGKVGDGVDRIGKGLEMLTERLGEKKEEKKKRKDAGMQTEEVSESEGMETELETESETESETDGEETEEEKGEKEDEEERVEETGEGEKEKEKEETDKEKEGEDGEK